LTTPSMRTSVLFCWPFWSAGHWSPVMQIPDKRSWHCKRARADGSAGGVLS
jgi:hypothetical protein